MEAIRRHWLADVAADGAVHRRQQVVVLARARERGGDAELAAVLQLARRRSADVVVVVLGFVGELAHGQREVAEARHQRRERKRHFVAETVVGMARSEEHTSELQSLMRISYAVFCFQKKKILLKTNNYT